MRDLDLDQRWCRHLCEDFVVMPNAQRGGYIFLFKMTFVWLADRNPPYAFAEEEMHRLPALRCFSTARHLREANFVCTRDAV